MAAGAPVIGHGTIWEIGDGTTGGDNVGRIVDMSLPTPEIEERETTHMTSAGRVREFIGGLTDLGDATFTIQWDAGSDEDVILQALRRSSAVRKHIITLPTSAGSNYYWEFQGWIKRIESQIPMDDIMTANITVRCASDVTEAATKPAWT